MAGQFRWPSWWPTLDLRSVINKTTAGITNDYKQNEIEDPKRLRALSRFLLTLMVGGILVAILVFLVSTRPDVRLHREKYKQEKFIQQANNTDKTFTCPCSDQLGMSWTRFIQFYFINPTDKEFIKVNINHRYFLNICKKNTNRGSVPWSQCIDAIAAMFKREDDRNLLQITNLLSPIMLNRTAPLLISSKLQLSPLFSMTPMVEEEYGLARQIALSFTIMLNQYKWNQYSSVQDFWNASEKYKHIMGRSIKKFAFGMEINWVKYEQGCNPEYCDVIERMSMHNKVFHAMAEVGGFSSVTLFIVRTFLWPPIGRIISSLSPPSPTRFHQTISMNPLSRTRSLP